MPPMQVVDRNGQREPWEPAQERPEGDVALHAGQRRTETMVYSVPKGEMTGLVPVEVESLGAGVSARVPVGGRQAGK